MTLTFRTPARAAGIAATALAVAAVAIAPQPLAAQTAKLVAGTLTCKGGAGVGLVLGSQKSYSCSFNPANPKRPNEHYRASVTKIGLDLGVTGNTIIVWTVLASTSDLPAGALRGSYAGVNADASLGLGAGAKLLVGGNKSSVTLQPLSVQGQTGVNLAVGVAGMSIK